MPSASWYSPYGGEPRAQEARLVAGTRAPPRRRRRRRASRCACPSSREAGHPVGADDQHVRGRSTSATMALQAMSSAGDPAGAGRVHVERRARRAPSRDWTTRRGGRARCDRACRWRPARDRGRRRRASAAASALCRRERRPGRWCAGREPSRGGARMPTLSTSQPSTSSPTMRLDLGVVDHALRHVAAGAGDGGVAGHARRLRGRARARGACAGGVGNGNGDGDGTATARVAMLLAVRERQAVVDEGQRVLEDLCALRLVVGPEHPAHAQEVGEAHERSRPPPPDRAGGSAPPPWRRSRPAA